MQSQWLVQVSLRFISDVVGTVDSDDGDQPRQVREDWFYHMMVLFEMVIFIGDSQ